MLTMEEAMRQTGKLPFAAGSIVKGTIIEIGPKEVLVDIGYKSEGVISANEFEDIKTVKVGDQTQPRGAEISAYKGAADGLRVVGFVRPPQQRGRFRADHHGRMPRLAAVNAGQPDPQL
jgi:hypothetical protein